VPAAAAASLPCQEQHSVQCGGSEASGLAGDAVGGSWARACGWLQNSGSGRGGGAESGASPAACAAAGAHDHECWAAAMT